MVAQPEDRQEYALQLADDALVLGQRLSEWCGRAPFLEEDIALTNVALDYIGRARMLYAYAAELDRKGRTEDDFAFLRDCRDYRNFLICELPRGDFAFTMTRQLLVDTFNVAFLERLARSADATLAAIAHKAIKESRYHLRRSGEWVVRLGDGTGESRRRMQRALDELWAYTGELFEMDALETRLATAGVAADRAALRPDWERRIETTLGEATLQRPGDDLAIRGGRAGIHTEHLGYLLAELQYMQRAYPGLSW